MLDLFVVHDQHADPRNLVTGGTDLHWVCEHANRQHELDNCISDDPEQTSFYKAMLIAQENNGGVLLVLDHEVKLYEHRESTGSATPFMRT